MIPDYCPYSVGDIPSHSEFLLDPFSLIRPIKAAQILFLKFSKDVSADLGNEFENGGSANQRVILQGGISLSSTQVSQRYCPFRPNF